MITSKVSNKAIANLNNNLPEIMNDRGILASYLLFSFITKLKHTGQYKLIKDPTQMGSMIF